MCHRSENDENYSIQLGYLLLSISIQLFCWIKSVTVYKCCVYVYAMHFQKILKVSIDVSVWLSKLCCYCGAGLFGDCYLVIGEERQLCFIFIERAWIRYIHSQ